MMTIGEIEKANVRSSIVFSGLSDQEFDLIYGTMRQRVLEKGELLYRQGDPGDSMAVLADGGLIVRVERPDGSMIDIERVQPGEILGEMTCVSPSVRSANVEATLESSGLKRNIVYELDRNTLNSIQQNAPRIATQILGGIITLVTTRLRGLDKRIRSELLALAPPKRPDPEPPPSREPSRISQAVRPRAVVGSESAMKGIVLPPGLDRADFDILSTACPLREHAPGFVLCKEGMPGTTCYIILKGEVEVIRAFAGGERLLTTMKAGSIAGQMALVDDFLRSATLRVSEAALVLEVSRQDFQKLLAASTPLSVRFQEQIAIAAINQHRAAIDRMKSVIHIVEQPKVVKADRPALGSKVKLAQEVAVLIADYLVGLDEWGVSLNDLEDMGVEVPAGQITPNELRARLRSS
jgi:CRP-like cAMP-binding protein